MDTAGGRVLFIVTCMLLSMLRHGDPTAAAEEVSIGVIIDLGTKSGRKSLTSIRMAVDDFYALHNNHTTTRIHLRVFDSKQENAVDAAAAGF